MRKMERTGGWGGTRGFPDIRGSVSEVPMMSITVYVLYFPHMILKWHIALARMRKSYSLSSELYCHHARERRLFMQSTRPILD